MSFRHARWALVATVVLFPGLGWAQQTSPVGQWKTIDEDGEAKSILAIAEENGTLSATIEKILIANADGSPHICDNCKGDLQGAPMEGLRIVWDMRSDGDEWNGRCILDPESCNVYKATIWQSSQPEIDDMNQSAL